MIEKLICRPHPRVFKMKKECDSLLNFISFFNVVNWYKKELIELLNNKIAKYIFNESEQNNLIRHMVYIPCRIKIGQKNLGTLSYPTCLTRMILSGMIKLDYEEAFKNLDNMTILKNRHVHICNVERCYCFHCYLVGSLCELYYKKGGTII